MTHVKFNRLPFEKSFNNLVDDLISEFPVIYKQGQNGYVPVNIQENEKAYSLEVVAPGFDKSDFKLNVEENMLTVSAEKATSESTEKVKQIRKEYNYRSFKRSFTLDEKIDASAIDAKYNNGVLTLNLPKKEVVKASAQTINIQ